MEKTKLLLNNNSSKATTTTQTNSHCKLAVLISGSGSNLQAVIDAISNGEIQDAEIALVISNKPNAYGLQRAEKAGIASAHIPSADKDKLSKTLEKNNIDAIVLAGYLSLLPSNVVSNYSGKIINIHPSLIPKYCGKGFYGLKVHQAVIEAKETETGATIHLVDEEYDTGKILIQEKVVVKPDDTAEILQKRVLGIEHEIIVKGVKMLVGGFNE